MAAIITKVYPAPPLCRSEVFRYARCKEPSKEENAILDECIAEARDGFSYRVCYGQFPLQIKGDTADVGFTRFDSRSLAKNLTGCESVMIFAATVGTESDRLVKRYSRLSPVKALFMQALGAERVEALCDAFCDEIIDSLPDGLTVCPRFSPGYDDLSLECQRDIFRILDCSKRIGVTLSDSLLMTPTKSVTALMGIRPGEKRKKKISKCDLCPHTDCLFQEMTK